MLQDLAATVTAYLEARPAPQQLGSGLNIAAVARRTGIGADTLRKWERRYGVLRPSRTSGGQRRYDERDVARVEWLRDRLSEGFRIGEAAALLETDHASAESSPAGLRDAIVAAVAETDTRRLAALVEQSFTLRDVETAVEEIVAPALRLIGDRWEDGAECIAEEHLLSEVVLERLRTLLGDRRPAVRGTAVLACAPGERHELGLLALAVLLQADGWLTVYLGTDTPIDAAVSTALRTDADLLCLSAGDADARAAIEAELEDYDLPEKLVVVTGGPAHGCEPPLKLGAAVAELRGARFSGARLGPKHGAARAGEEAGLDSSGITSVSVTGRPSNRSTASRLPPPARTCSTSAAIAGRSQSSSGSRSGTSVRPPRSTKSAASPPSSTTCAPATRAARAPARFGQGSAAPYGCAGSAAASTSGSGSSSSARSSRSRSTAPASANCAPPRPSTK